MRTRKAETGHEASAVKAPIQAQPTRSLEHPLQRLQHLVGNQAVMRLLVSGRVAQPRLQALRVGPAGDQFELEADRVADTIVRMSEPSAQRVCAECEEEKGTDTGTIRRSHAATLAVGAMQGQESQGKAPSEAPQIVSDVIAESGRPLAPLVRSFMEPRFGYDFSRVRIHTGGRATESARAVNAVAYTVGRDIVFDEGAYRPETDSGRHIIAHELTHVIQQGAADRGIEPESEEELGDSGTLPEGQRMQRYGNTDVRVQRQEACYCCVSSVGISNVNRIDNATHMGHSFDLTITMPRATEHGPRLAPECTLEWWEKTNVPYVAGMAADTWTDMFESIPFAFLQVMAEVESYSAGLLHKRTAAPIRSAADHCEGLDRRRVPFRMVASGAWTAFHFDIEFKRARHSAARSLTETWGIGDGHSRSGLTGRRSVSPGCESR